ncbi:hypothetical protein PHIM7_361 [Sinorhizobium phage phiM7]|uniref:Uncharacterized protein n=2 Tax=Emdodecavirus TaxID=1980937 RepID=S5MW01_9CAUD|nr:hypothetical protein AB690_gp154 [Sinorhizobium phage phiM12]YP_009601486.1 hypothetical protein FDH46_gp117 [Sinorhizobium phage phiM7]AGR48097.1 hypothetical protein SmphiM12_465 [Sinorhizobium phage phiM12]AKF12906.1 hypothetical protein PHIM7_361 [Sinorhizobium phage phiM7]AKF13266.1 hypothetical protein PHIM19_361 [Sinorhizobium phage phiM19]
MELFLRKYESGEPFELMDGSRVTFTFDESVYNSIQEQNFKVTFECDGKQYRFSNIAKNEEFGGGDCNLARENTQIEKLSERIKSLGAVDIQFRDVTYTVVDCVSTPGTPKADFHFISENGDDCLWTSHKHGTDATHFQQWGGMSQRREPEVHAHEEVQSFIEDVKSKYPEGLPNKTSLFRRIKSPELKLMSAYGNAYGSGDYGPQNVTLVCQGDVKIENSKICAYRLHENGDELKYSFEPVLSAVYKGDRNDSGIPNTRLGIIPLGSRTMTSKI